MKIAVALLALILATVLYAITSSKRPVPALAIERCHWHGDEAVNCQHILAESHRRTSRSSKKRIFPL